MGEVAVDLQIMPDDMENFGKIKEAISDTLKNHTGGLVKRFNIGEKEIAFGMKAISITYVMEDAGGMEKIEEKLKAIEHVSSCETIGMDRL